MQSLTPFSDTGVLDELKEMSLTLRSCMSL